MLASEQGSSKQKSTSNVDIRSVEDQAAPPEVHTALQRKLKNRHVAMISIGGVIGTGLFVGTAPSLMNGGPLGILLGYLFIGLICLATMLSLGEMVTFLPLPGGFIKLAERFVDPAFALAIGWNYWYQWTVGLPAELAAAATVVRYWDKHTSPAICITVCLVVAIGINALGVGAYGEAEFWFSSIKVVTITGMIVLGIVLDLGGGPTHDRIGFRYWKDPGPFANYTWSTTQQVPDCSGRMNCTGTTLTTFHEITGPEGQFLGTCSVVTQAMFSYVGTEAVAMAAAEARNPRRNLPKAIKKIYLRILVLYIGSVFIIGLLVPSNSSLLHSEPDAEIKESPFTIALKLAGFKVLPSIVNAAILTSASSAGSSDLYLASRSLYGLAVAGCAPKYFSRTMRSGLPYVALIICSCFALFAYMSIKPGSNSGILFLWLSKLSSTAGLVTWFGIGVTYIRFYQGLKAQGIDRKTLPFSSRMQPFLGWFCICGTGFILFFSAWDVFLKDKWSAREFVTDYFPIVFFPILYFTAKFFMRVRTVKADKMDFKTNIEDFDNMTYDEPPPKNRLEAFWMWLI